MDKRLTKKKSLSELGSGLPFGSLAPRRRLPLEPGNPRLHFRPAGGTCAETFLRVRDAASSEKENALACEFLSHNQQWGADYVAHIGVGVIQGTVGYEANHKTERDDHEQYC
jgi:hypothetical protein